MSVMKINFDLAKDLNEDERNATLNAINTLTGAYNAAVSDTASEIGKRLGSVTLPEGANAEKMLEQVQLIPNIIAAEIPPR